MSRDPAVAPLEACPVRGRFPVARPSLSTVVRRKRAFGLARYEFSGWRVRRPGARREFVERLGLELRHLLGPGLVKERHYEQAACCSNRQFRVSDDRERR